MGEEPSFKLVPLTSIVEWLEPRDFADEDVENMAASLRIHGQIEPIVVEPIGGGLFRGICGRLRFEGAKRAGFQFIEAKIVRFNSESERVAYQLAENLHRKELTVFQKAKALKRYRDLVKQEHPDLSMGEVMKIVASNIERMASREISEDTVYRYIQVEEHLPEEVKSVFGVDSKIGLEHCRILLRLKNKPEEQMRVARMLAEEPMPVQRLEKIVESILRKEEKKEKKADVWVCDCCEKEYRSDEWKRTVVLCSRCAGEFEVWRHDAALLKHAREEEEPRVMVAQHERVEK